MVSQRGFTLVELIAVIVVLGIVATLSTRFFVSSVDSYSDAQLKQRLLAKGRTSVEQITRYLRSAVPNSVRVSSSGLCVEMLPTVGGAFYEGQVADAQNGASATSNISVSPVTLGLGRVEHAVIGGLLPDDIYATSSPSARAQVASTSGSPVTGLTFTTPHRFIRNSINSRVFLADDPVRICLSSGELRFSESYGAITALNDGTPSGASSAIMSDGVSANGTAFALSNGTEDRNASLEISLTFSRDDESLRVPIKQIVLIRNVP